MTIDVVVPTIGRDSLTTLIDSLAQTAPGFAGRVIVVDDRKNARDPLPLDPSDPWIRRCVEVVRGSAHGPAAARNAGWQRSRAEWICFVDDDVRLSVDWYDALLEDLTSASCVTAAVQGVVRVPLDPKRAPTDWERNVAGLEGAAWITADMAYRRDVLLQLDGFDERFRRAYREDSDLALRAMSAGYALCKGRRNVVHPVRPADRWISVRLQAGNADDVLMQRIHGRDWRRAAESAPGAWQWHAATVASAAIAVAAAAGWAALTSRFAWSRIAPGPRTAEEISTILATSAVIPFCAVYHRLRGCVAAREPSREIAAND